MGPPSIAEGDVKIAVIAEVDITGIVIVVVIELGDQRNFAVGVGLVGVGFGDAETGDTIEGFGFAIFLDGKIVREIEITIFGVVGVEGDTEYAPLTAIGPAGGEFLVAGQEDRVEIQKDVFVGLGGRKMIDHRDAAVTFNDKQTVFFTRWRAEGEGGAENQAGKGIDGGVTGGDGKFGREIQRLLGLAHGHDGKRFIASCARGACATRFARLLGTRCRKESCRHHRGADEASHQHPTPFHHSRTMPEKVRRRKGQSKETTLGTAFCYRARGKTNGLGIVSKPVAICQRLAAVWPYRIIVEKWGRVNDLGSR